MFVKLNPVGSKLTTSMARHDFSSWTAGFFAIPLDGILCCLLLLISCGRLFGLNRADMVPLVGHYRRLLPLLVVAGAIFFVGESPWLSQCKKVSCYATTNRTDGTCDPCTGPHCPGFWGNPAAAVAMCKAQPTESHSVLCGEKYCHKSFGDLSIFGLVHLDCDGGSEGNAFFLGFPTPMKDNEKSVGEVEAQRNCKAHNWILPTVLGLGRVVLMLHHMEVLDQSLKKKSSRFFLSPWLTPIMVGVYSVLMWAFVYA